MSREDVVPGDVVVRKFSGNYLIWRVREQKESLLVSSHEGLGQSDDRDWALTRASELARGLHAVWFCDPNERYRKIRSARSQTAEDTGGT